MKRRSFIKIGTMGGVGLYVSSGLGFVREAFARIPGGTLPAGDVNKYTLPLVKPPVMPGRSNPKKDQYRIAVRQFKQRILSPPHPQTTIWSYGSVDHPGTVAEGGTFNYPAFTIEASWNRTVQVQWRNELKDPGGHYLPHLLPVDPTLHWANPPGGLAHRDQRPVFDATPGPYLGPVPMVTHVHGAHTTEDSDGYAEAWYLPDADNIPAGYARTGTFFDYFNAKYGHGWDPGVAAFKYPNDQRATTLWYHDHTLGMTRLNVYAGPAGFYLIRGGPDDLDLGYVAPGVGDDPLGEYTEIPIVIQDRAFNEDGSLFYPDSRAFFDSYGGPYVPESPVPPIWNPEVFGNMMVVNGFTWPYLEVEQRRYRFRFLNGCNSRFIVLKMTTSPRQDNASLNVAEKSFWQIGADGGFLPVPVELDHLLMAPSERADVIVDFADMPVGTEVYLVNDGPDAPFESTGIEDISDWASTGQVMKFVVKAATEPDPTAPPFELQLPFVKPLPPASTIRSLSLSEEAYEPADVPTAALLGLWADTGGGHHEATPLLWDDPITENPEIGATEDWELVNLTEDAHPIHIHQVQFRVLGRQSKDGGPVNPPEPWETGYKDTVIAYPGEVTRVRAKFDIPGFYVWHCHIVEHEDNEMMRPFHVGPIPPTTSVEPEAPAVTMSAYPQPFNPSTMIRFELPQADHVTLEVFDVTGRRVASLVNGPMPAGLQHVPFDGSGLPSGLYLSRLRTAGQTLTRKMLLVK